MSTTSTPKAAFQTFTETADATAVAPRVAKVRESLKTAGFNAFLVPRADVHRGESVPAGDARLAWLTGFTGSAGMAIIGTQKAALLVDSRYTLQAPTQTNTDLIDVHEVPPASASVWIIENLPQNSKIAFDPWLHTKGEISALTKKLDGHATLVPTENLVDINWPDRPTAPASELEILGTNRAGKSATEKLAELQETLIKAKADSVVFTMPESLCWLFNIRARDVPNTPFVLGFAIVPAKGRPTLFLSQDKLDQPDVKQLAEVAELAQKSQFPKALETLGEGNQMVWIDPGTAPEALSDILDKAGAKLLEKTDPVMAPKAKKNDAEIAGFREAHSLDAVAMAKFMYWLDTEAPKGILTEIDIVKKLEACRREDETLVDISFDTISGAGPHGAVIHYRVTEATSRTLKPGELMLVDSGGQYLSGTTDITRTFFTGSATPEQKDRYTRVLKGMIAISMARFPKGTTGAQLDTLARQFLWQDGITYTHGTGHGVGAFLSVHEGPIGIAPRYTTPLAAGNVLSNEPGYYKPDEYGIRIENLLHVIESDVADGYLEFETLTLSAIDTRLIDNSLLVKSEVNWLNDYHARVFKETAPKLRGAVRTWLENATKPI